MQVQVQQSCVYVSVCWGYLQPEPAGFVVDAEAAAKQLCRQLMRPAAHQASNKDRVVKKVVGDLYSMDIIVVCMRPDMQHCLCPCV